MVATMQQDQATAVDNTSVESDQLYKTARETLRSIAELVCGSVPETATSAPSTTTQSKIFSSILVLKSAHRLLCENLEVVRQETQGVKATLDATSLKLENLRYQERHYQREIRACRTFTEDMEQSLMGDGIELVSEEEYKRYIAEEMQKDRLLQAVEEEEESREAGNNQVHMMEEEDREGLEDEEEEDEEEGQVEEGEEGEEEMASEEKEDGEDAEMVEADPDRLKTQLRTSRNPKSRADKTRNDAQDHAHIFKLGRLHYEVERRQQALEELAALKSERDAVAADVAKRHTISSEISSEVARLKTLVEKQLAAFEGNGAVGLNVNAPEFHFSG